MATKTEGVDIAKLTAEFPPEAIKQRKGGGNKSLSYVEGHSVINRLNAATGNNWTFTVDRLDQQGDLFLAFVTLTLPGMGSRSHIGVQRFAANSGEDLIKGAITDALKKAATLFGVGIELYGDDYEEHPEPPVTERTMKVLHALGAKKGFDHAAIHNAAAKAYGVESSNDMTEAQALKLIGVLEKKPNVAAQPKPAAAAGVTLGHLRVSARLRGLDDARLLNIAGPMFGVEALEQLEPESIAALDKHVKETYEEMKGATA